MSSNYSLQATRNARPSPTLARTKSMSLIAGLSSAKDLLAKLKGDADLLDEEVTSDRFFNFVVTGYSLIDWVKNDPSIPAAVQTAAISLYSGRWLKVCGDLATASKHFTLSTRVPITATASSHRGFGVGRYGKGGWGEGEEHIEVRLNDGTVFSGLDLVKGVLQTWNQFFATHGLCCYELTPSARGLKMWNDSRGVGHVSSLLARSSS